MKKTNNYKVIVLLIVISIIFMPHKVFANSHTITKINIKNFSKPNIKESINKEFDIEVYDDKKMINEYIESSILEVNEHRGDDFYEISEGKYKNNLYGYVIYMTFINDEVNLICNDDDSCKVDIYINGIKMDNTWIYSYYNDNTFSIDIEFFYDLRKNISSKTIDFDITYPKVGDKMSDIDIKSSLDNIMILESKWIKDKSSGDILDLLTDSGEYDTYSDDDLFRENKEYQLLIKFIYPEYNLGILSNNNIYNKLNNFISINGKYVDVVSEEINSYINNYYIIYDISYIKEYFKINYELNGHGNKIKETIVKPNEIAIKPKDPIDLEYIFTGWYLDKDLSLEYTFSKPVRHDLILYAKWEKKEIDNPQTNDNIIYMMIIEIISLIIMILLKIHKF